MTSAPRACLQSLGDFRPHLFQPDVEQLPADDFQIISHEAGRVTLFKHRVVLLR
jgi:hypothetical protein